MEDEAGGGRSRRYEYGGETNAPTASITLGGILSIKQTPPYRIHDRTLLDLIRDDPTYGKESKNTWKMLRQKLRLKLAGAVCTTAVPTLVSHVHVTGDSNPTATRHSTAEVNSVAGESTRRLNSPLVNNSNTNASSVMDTETQIVRTETPAEEIERTLTEEVRSRGGGGDGGPAGGRMSLMSLLEFDGSSYLLDDEEEEVDDVALEDGGDGGGCSGGGGGDNKYNNCCVCMVRHKGAAFIPCGHTFCRLCSRELFVKRASCPLCNHFIVEILDIF